MTSVIFKILYIHLSINKFNQCISLEIFTQWILFQFILFSKLLKFNANTYQKINNASSFSNLFTTLIKSIQIADLEIDINSIKMAYVS